MKPTLDVSAPKGDTFDGARDGKRLAHQRQRVLDILLDGSWITLGCLSVLANAPEASCSARIRQLRSEGFVIEREYVERGLWRYRLVKRDLFEGLQ